MKIIGKLNKINIFLPVSTKLILWNLFTIFFLLGDYVVTILVNCYNNHTTKIILYDAINNILPFVLFADILVQFNTGFIKNGKIILQRRPANLYYMKSFYFYCDIISFVMSILQISFTHTFAPQISILNYIVFIKLFKVKYFDTIFKKYVIKSFSFLLYYEMIKNFIFLTLLVHTIGSFYFYLDVVLYETYNYPQSQLWVFNSSAMTNIYLQSFWVQYTYSFYVACVTLSGTAYGDIVPQNPIETVYIFGCFVFPMLIYAYVFASIFNALSTRRSTSANIRRYKFLAKEYLKSLGVNYKVMNKIVTYIEFTYKKDMVVDSNFLDDLAPTVKKQYINSTIQGKFKYDCFQIILKIANLDQSYLKQKIYDKIKQEYFPQRFTLLTSQKLKLYYINTGKIVQVVRLKQDKKLSKPIKSQNHVAKTAFFTNQIPTQKVRYQSNSFVVCHSIDYKDFKQLIKEKMPTLNEAYCLLQNQILDEKKYELMQQNCYFCQENTHILLQCPHLNPNRNEILQKSYSYQQQRQKHNRDKQFNKPKIIQKSSMLIKLSYSENQNNKSYKNTKKVFISGAQKVENNLVSLFLDREFYTYLSEFNIKQKNHIQQVTQSQLNQICLQNNVQVRKDFQKICFWDRYYPQWNII